MSGRTTKKIHFQREMPEQDDEQTPERKRKSPSNTCQSLRKSENIRTPTRKRERDYTSDNYLSKRVDRAIQVNSSASNH